jgi:hypothetical protein
MPFISGVQLNLFSKLALKSRLRTHCSLQSKNTKNTNNAKSEVRFIKQLIPDLYSVVDSSTPLGINLNEHLI